MPRMSHDFPFSQNLFQACEVHNPGYICYIVDDDVFTVLHFVLHGVTLCYVIGNV